MILKKKVQKIIMKPVKMEHTLSFSNIFSQPFIHSKIPISIYNLVFIMKRSILFPTMNNMYMISRQLMIFLLSYLNSMVYIAIRICS